MSFWHVDMSALYGEDYEEDEELIPYEVKENYVSSDEEDHIPSTLGLTTVKAEVHLAPPSCSESPPQSSPWVIHVYDKDGNPVNSNPSTGCDEVEEDFLIPDSHELYESKVLMDSEWMQMDVDQEMKDDIYEKRMNRQVAGEVISEVMDEKDEVHSERRARNTLSLTRKGLGCGGAIGRGRRQASRRGRGSREGRGRGSRGGRGRGSRGGRGSTSRRYWASGDHLTEVCIHDEDVPAELKEMVMDVVRRRETDRIKVENSRKMAREAKKRKRSQIVEKRSENEEDDEDEFYEADDGRDAALLQGDHHFNWSPMATFQGQRENFTECTGSVKYHATAYDAFRAIWDDRIINDIAVETNRYASSIPSENFKKEWYPTNSHEILCLFAFWMMLAVIRMPTIASCFSLNPLLKIDIFRKITTRDRYNNLSRALHFVNTTSDVDPNDRLHCLRPIIDHLNKKFQTSYIPSQNMTIDESLTLWKGNLSFKQYIQSKAAKCGIKTFELCESATGYLWSFIVYTGKGSIENTRSVSTVLNSISIVIKLIRPLLNKGYTLFMDNWFNSPLLARFLKRNGTDCVGTLRPSRRALPPLVSLATLKQGQFVARHSGDICVMGWQDKKKILTISTYHGTEQGQTPSKPHQVPQWKPQVVLDYSKHMGGVDMKDQMLEPYLLERKRGAKWYMKFFKHLLNCSIFNARILLRSATGRPQDHLVFRLQLVGQILDSHLSHCPRIQRISSHGNSSTHWPVRVSQAASDRSANHHTRLRCVLCSRSGTYKRTQYRCESCNVPLCIESCFKSYHVDSM